MPTDNPFLRHHKVALYREITDPTWVCMFEYYHTDEEDATYHTRYVRISDPVEVSFQPLSTDATVQSALRALDAREKELRLGLAKELAKLEDWRAQLRALPHLDADAPDERMPPPCVSDHGATAAPF